MNSGNTLASRHTVSNYFAREHLANAVALGGNERDIMAIAGLTHEQLKQPKARVLAPQLASIVVSCWKLSGDELFGFTKQKIKLGMFSLLSERLINCKNLEGVLMYIKSFYTLTGDQLLIDINQKASQVHLTVNANFKSRGSISSPNSLLIELLLLICHRFSSWLLGQVVPLNRVFMRHSSPSHHEEYRLMFSCPYTFECEYNALVFDAKYLSSPVVRNQQDLKKYLNDIPLQWFKKQSYYDTCSSQVIRILEESDFGKECNIDSISATLGITSRTLRRRLTAEGCMFQNLKDNARRDHAINLFERSELTISDIGIKVGFTEAATFTRAFKHWTGVSPSTYRKYSS